MSEQIVDFVKGESGKEHPPAMQKVLAKMHADVLNTRANWMIHPAISTEKLIPSMFIQIPVENAIKYAFQPDFDHAFLQIVIQPEAGANTKAEPAARLESDTRLETAAIRITIEDNGVGYNPDRPSDHRQGTGSGLKMLRRTVDLLNENNSVAMTFKIENRSEDVPPGQGTRVTLIIPSNTQYTIKAK